MAVKVSSFRRFRSNLDWLVFVVRLFSYFANLLVCLVVLSLEFYRIPLRSLFYGSALRLRRIFDFCRLHRRCFFLYAPSLNETYYGNVMYSVLPHCHGKNVVFTRYLEKKN
jgi:hypothetical protein